MNCSPCGRPRTAVAASPRRLSPGRQLDRLCVLTLVTAVLLSAGGSSSAAAPLAVLSHSITLPGVRPIPPDTGTYLEVPYSAALNPTGGALTLEGWVKRDAVNRRETLVGNGWHLSYWLGFSANGKISFTPHGTDGLVDGNATIPAGEWTHIAVTYDGGVRRYFINGVLDTYSSEHSGPLVGAAPKQALDIGYDRDDDFTPNFFGGAIDNLRLWNVVRDAGQLRDTMYLTFAAPEPGLLAEWSFDGMTSDPVGGHNAMSYGAIVFSNEGAIPHDVSIPKSIGTHILDGQCDLTGEYINALQLTLDGSALWLAHTATDLWVCAQMASSPSLVSMSVYLDPAYTRLDPAQPEHVRLTVAADGSRQAEVGTGTGGYTPTTAFDKQWAGVWAETPGVASVAEFRINVKMLGSWDRVIGLALERITDLFGRPVQRLWPAGAGDDLPSTWSSATLEGTSVPRTFQGWVVYQPPADGSEALGVAGVRVNLIGSNPGGSESLVQTTLSGPNGEYSLTGHDAFAGHRLELGSPPWGYFPQSAQAGTASPSADPHSLDFGASPGGMYADNLFAMGAFPGAQPVANTLERGPYYLIITSTAMKESGALDEYVAFKRRMGFSVEVKSIESIASTYPGATLRDKIRSLEIERKAAPAFSERFRYLLLVGTDSVIPFAARFAIYFNGKDSVGNVDPDACSAGPSPSSENANLEGLTIKWSDWPYADLHSDFDSNGNGCLLDGILMADNPTSPAPGYAPDVLPYLWWADVAVGRIPFDDAGIVETVLANSMGAEQQSQDYKARTLSAMSYTRLQGQYWYPKNNIFGTYFPCPSSNAANDRCQGYTEDMADVSEDARSAFLESLGYSLTTLYEGNKAPDANPAVPTMALTEANVIAELSDQRYGMVNLAGHGSAEGVGRTYWNNLNGNATVDSPTAPILGTSQDEITKTVFLIGSDLIALPPANEHGAIYNVSACSSGCPLPACSPSFGATVLQSGAGIAWVGGLNRTSSSMQYGLMERLFEGDRRLGDALWETLAQKANDDFSGSAEFSTQLYGDPTLSYWGDPGGQATLAAWPMLRYNAIGQGYSPLPGPAAARALWSYAGAAPSGGTLQPSPVASNTGEVIVADGTHLDMLRNGALYQQLALDAPAFGTPALAADGTLYALDTGGSLYAFTQHLHILPPAPPTRSRRWKIGLGAAPRTSPVVGADGLIAVGVEGKVLLVRPYGSIARSYAVAGNPVGELAYGADRTLYAATTAGSVYLIPFGSDEECGDCRIHGGPRDSPPNSTPPLVAWGRVYVGREDGSVLLLDATTLEQKYVFDAGSSIAVGPIAAPGARVVVGTADGEVYGLDGSTLAIRWHTSSGATLSASAPASSADAVYLVMAGHLVAFSPASGAPLWSRSLGDGILAGSVAVGPNREIYVQADNGKVVGLGQGFAPVFGVSQAAVLADTGIRGIQVSWQLPGPPPPDSPGTLLQRSTPAGAWHDLAVVPSATSIYTDTRVLDNGVYAYRVQVLGAGGEDSDFSSSPYSVRSLPAPPHAPELLAVGEPTAASLKLAWRPAPGDVVDAYRIERSPSAGGPFSSVLQLGGQVTTTVDGELAPGTTYHYRVMAANATGESAPSNVLSSATRHRTLAAPTDVTAALLRDGAVQIGWRAGPAGATTVIEYVQLDMDAYAPLALVGAVGPYRYNAGEPGTYHYRLKFVQGNDESDYATTNLLLVMPRRLYLPLVMR
jgi:outer membrane protein assembly factor BamB